jgi:hypothetical protein
MRIASRLGLLALAAVVMLVPGTPPPVQGYIGGPPATLGMMCWWSTHVMVVRLEKFDREKGVLLFRKVQDLKGRWPTDQIRHAVPATLPDRAHILQWAEPGKQTVIFALENYKWSHTYMDGLWYASVTTDWQWWNVSHPEPILLRTWSGRSQRLVTSATAILGGKDVVAPCLVGDNPDDLRLRSARVQRLRASLKLLDYNPRRDFLGWDTDDLTPLRGMPGFTHKMAIPGVGADAHTIAAADFNGDGRPDLCLASASGVLLAANTGDWFTDTLLPTPVSGCRAAIWADYNSDGKPDLLLATPTGPKLYTNLGNGNFRDDSYLIPREPTYNLTAAAWIDYDGDGRPDILLGNGFHGLRLYRNKGQAEPLPPAKPGVVPPPPPPPASLWFEDVSDAAGLGERGVGSSAKGDTLAVCDVNGDGRLDFLYGAGEGLLALNTHGGFVEAKDCGIRYRAGGVGPVFGDFDGDGRPDLFVPQPDGCKLFHNDGDGHFTDVTAKAGLAEFQGHATSAAWGDLDVDGHLDLVVGCLRSPNRFFRNRGDGTFEDATERIGLHKQVYNTQAVCLTDLNGDGVLDVIFNNEGQDATVLLGNPKPASRRTPVVIQVGGSGVTGSRVRVVGAEGQVVATHDISGGDGRSQPLPSAHFALAPGAYQVEVRYSSGLRRARRIEVGRGVSRAIIDDQTPPVE